MLLKKYLPFITKNILLLSVVSFFTDVASEMLYPVIPLYLSSIGIGISGIGIMEGIAEMLAALSKTYFGIWSDRVRKRKIFIIVGYGFSALSKPLMVLLKNYYWVKSMRVSDRLGKGIRTAPRDALLSDESTIENKGKVFGFHRAIDTFGAAVGPALSLILMMLYHLDYSTLFMIAFLPGIGAMLFSYFIREEKTVGVYKKTETKKRIALKDLFAYWNVANTNYKKVVIVLLLFYIFNSSDMLLLLKAKASGITEYQIILLFILYNISYAVCAYPFGMLGDKWGLKTMISFGISIFGIVYMGVSVFSNLWIVIFLFILYGIYSAAIEGNIKAILSNVSKREDTATAIGLFTSLQSFTFLISNVLAGWIWSSFGADVPFMISGIVALGISVYLFLVKL